MNANLNDSQDKPVRSRTRTGCITCRIRRVKCDEARPSCQRCVASKRQCDGYGPALTAQLSRRELSNAIKQMAPGLLGSRMYGPAGASQATDAVACFDFFRARTAQSASTFMASGFWDHRFLQVAHAEPAVWNAAAAIGSLHRRYEVSAMSQEPWQGLQYAEQATRNYGQAMALARNIRDPSSMLVLSVALIAVANLSGRWVDSRVHLVAARKLLDNLKRSKGGRLGQEHMDIADSLLQMDLDGAAVVEASAPYEPSVQGPQPTATPDISFHSLKQAGMRLLDMTRRFLTESSDNSGDPDLDKHLEVLRRSLVEDQLLYEATAWEDQMKSFVRQMSKEQLQKEATAILWIKLHHATLRLCLKSGTRGPETRWDAGLAHCERIISLAAALYFSVQSLIPSVVSLDPGLVMPLYVVVTRCRHPIVRRRALALLWRVNRQEGVWHSIACAAVGQSIIQHEEKDLGISIPERVYLSALDMERWGDKIGEERLEDWLDGDLGWESRASWDSVVFVPETHRFLELAFTADMDGGRVILTIIFSTPDELGQPRMAHTTVTF